MIKLMPLIEHFRSMDDLYDIYYDAMREVLLDFKSGKYEKQPWRTIEFPRLKKIWEDFVKTGVVRDEKGLDKIIDIICENAMKIEINNFLSGHSSDNPDEEFKSFDITTEEEKDKFYEWIIDDTGTSRISDYGIKPIFDLIRKLFAESDYSNKLILVDRVLNVIHQRSDLTSWFLEGGSKSLNTLSGYDND